MTPFLTIAVVSFNTKDLLRACLESLEGLGDEVCVVVVDNRSRDYSAEMVRSEFEWAELIASERNLGFGPAVNAAVDAFAPSEWIVAANADTVVRAGTLEELLRAARRHPRAAVLAPRLELPSGETQDSVYAFPRVTIALLAAAGVHRFNDRISRWMFRRSWDGSVEGEVEWAMGAFLAIRADVFRAIGGFDSAQWMYAEDLDLCWRARESGWRTVYVPSATVEHVGGASTAAEFGAKSGTLEILTAYHAWLRRRKGAVVARVVATISVGSAALRLLFWRVARAGGSKRASTRVTAARSWLDLNIQATRKPN